MTDRIFAAFLHEQNRAGLELAAESDLLDLIPGGPPGQPPDHYLARFSCRGLVRDRGGEVREAESFMVGIRFPSDYLLRVRVPEVVWWLDPITVFHPNVTSGMSPGFICLGRVTPGTSLVSIIQQVFDIITYKKVTYREDDAINRDACTWTRANKNRLPIDDRPLRRRRLVLNVERLAEGRT